MPQENIGPQPEQLTRPPQKVSAWQVVKAGLNHIIAERRMESAFNRTDAMQENADKRAPYREAARVALIGKGPNERLQPIKPLEVLARKRHDSRRRANFRQNVAAANLEQLLGHPTAPRDRAERQRMDENGEPYARRTRKEQRQQAGARQEIDRARYNNDRRMGKIRSAAEGRDRKGRSLEDLQSEEEQYASRFETAEERYRDTLRGRARYLETRQRNSRERQQIIEYQDQPEVLPEGSKIMSILGNLVMRGEATVRRIDDTERQRTINDLNGRVDRIDADIAERRRPIPEEAADVPAAAATPEAPPAKTKEEIAAMSNKEYATYLEDQMDPENMRQERENAYNEMSNEDFVRYVRGQVELESERLQAQMRTEQGVAKLTNPDLFLAGRQAKSNVMQQFGRVSRIPEFWQQI